MISLKAKPILRGALFAVVGAFASGASGQTVMEVSGTDAETLGQEQSEAAASISVFPDGRQIEVIAPNDDHSLFVTDAFTRRVFAGASLMGWYFRERTANVPDPPWLHGRLLPGTGNASNAAVIWGDPGVGSAPDNPNVVLMGSLFVPNDKFPAAPDPECIHPVSGATVGCIKGSVVHEKNCSPLGGACVARSIDGGKTFEMVQCFSNKDPGVCTEPVVTAENGHFYDGMDVAIERGPSPKGYIGVIDADSDVEALLVLDNAETGTSLSLLRNHVGAIGPTDSLGAITSHVRLRVDEQNRLWRMSKNGTELKVNFLGRSASPKLCADNLTPLLAAPVAGLPPGVNDPSNVFADTVRFGPQYDFDIGRNENGLQEMRFVYLATDRDMAGTIVSTHIQAGFCPIDLPISSECTLVPQWHSSVSPGSNHKHFHPAIKYGFDSIAQKHIWKVTWYELDDARQTVALFAGDLTREPSLTVGGVPLQAVAIEDTRQQPCPDDRSSEGKDANDYWGDYDDMYFNSERCSFVRPFTDSRRGCVSRTAFAASHQHVGAVEIPCDPNRQDPNSVRRVTVSYDMFVNDDEFGQGDDCTTWGFSKAGCSRASGLSLFNECVVSPTAPIFGPTLIFSECVDNEVRGQVELTCELEPDQRSVRVTLKAMVRDECNDPVDDFDDLQWVVPAGGSVGGTFLAADTFSQPSNGPPFDLVEVHLAADAIRNERAP